MIDCGISYGTASPRGAEIPADEVAAIHKRIEAGLLERTRSAMQEVDRDGGSNGDEVAGL